MAVYHTALDRKVYLVAWSGDGSKIAFLEESELRILDLSTHVISDVHTLEGHTVGLSWAHHSDKLVYDDDGMMYLLELDENLEATGPPEPLGPGTSPSWSSDDTRIVFDDRSRLYIMNLETGEVGGRLHGQWFADWRPDLYLPPGSGGGE